MLMTNYSFNMIYFFLARRYLDPAIKFISLIRIFLFNMLSRSIYVREKMINHGQHTYRVNLNELFDQDHDFLFENDAFKTLIKTVVENHGHLVNPNFDVNLDAKGTARVPDP